MFFMLLAIGIVNNEYRRILGVSWTEWVANAKKLKRVGKEAEIVDMAKAEKLA